MKTSRRKQDGGVVDRIHKKYLVLQRPLCLGVILHDQCSVSHWRIIGGGALVVMHVSCIGGAVLYLKKNRRRTVGG